MSDFTKGPWEVEYNTSTYPYCIVAPNGDDRAKGAVGTRVLRWGAFMLPSSAEAAANARLIAAAPELLEALEQVARLRGTLETHGLLAMVDAAIAKACGE